MMKILNFLINKYYYVCNLIVFKINKISLTKFYINGIIYIKNDGIIIIEDNFSGNSGKSKNPIGGDTILRLIVNHSSAELKIGSNTGISNSTIVCWKKIHIGKNVVVGGSVKIWDTNFHSLDPVLRTSGNDTDIQSSPIYIEDNVFIGSASIILKGVTIGQNSIIRAGSVVTNNIPSNVIAGGNPCIVIRSLELIK